MIDETLSFNYLGRKATTVGTTPTQILTAGRGRNFLSIENTHATATLYVGHNAAGATAATFTQDVAATATRTLHGFQGPLWFSGTAAATSYDLRFGWSRGDTPVI